ncbi:hypothetical protein SH668x_003715 [Planctomicrobium sp. SH668]|jgi:hypothetical protein|uniref:hypothetical protein n=1 Tax=Planctomicrobium sp. SH668 TaxID=3448126 RepID=UPI003F5C5289|nr:hypothetical protein [Planctomycetaceae bacterium]
MSSEQTPLWQQMLAKRREWLESQPSLSGQLAAMGREMVKDVRSSVHESFFGRPEHAAEPGTPGNPTQYMINQDLGTVHGNYDHSQDQALPADAELQQYVTPDPEQAQQQSLKSPRFYGPADEQAISDESELQRYVSRAQESQQERGVER